MKYHELSEESKQRALEFFQETACDYDWWYECIFEDCKEIFKILGITSEKRVELKNGSFRYEPDIQFTGFYSQGDGASFTGTYSYQKASCANIRAYAPYDKELHQIADALAAVQRKHFYKIVAEIYRMNSHYSHEHSVHIEANVPDTVEEPLRDLMRWIYKRLQAEYEYQTSEEAALETIEANSYDFDEDGSLA